MINKIWTHEFYTNFLNKENIELLDTFVADNNTENESILGFELSKKGLKEYFI